MGGIILPSATVLDIDSGIAHDRRSQMTSDSEIRDKLSDVIKQRGCEYMGEGV